MSRVLAFDRSFDPRYGEAVEVAARIRRLTANNPGPFTFLGTNTYLVGRGEVAVIDPGPRDERHLAAVLAATAGETVTHIVLTHTHRDHLGNLAALAAATGAQVVGCAPLPVANEATEADASDGGYRPHRVLGPGEPLAGAGWTLEAVPTPGHTLTHLAFALPEEAALFSGDHVMAWSTTVVSPPQGSMRAYRRSLSEMLDRADAIYFPGHGPPLRDPKPFVTDLIRHREEREAAILARLAAGPQRIPDIVPAVYGDIDPRLLGGAAMSVLAHLEELVEDGRAAAEGGRPAVDGVFRLRQSTLRLD